MPRFARAVAASTLAALAPCALAQVACDSGVSDRFAGLTLPNAEVSALCVFDDGSGPALYAGGGFTAVGGLPAFGIARWDGERWSAVGGGLRGDEVSVRAMTVFNDGSGPALYVGGRFDGAYGVDSPGIIKWTGDAWEAVGDGVNGEVRALAPGGALALSRLFVGGEFTHAGGVEVNHIATWDGELWVAFGDGATRRQGGLPGGEYATIETIKLLPVQGEDRIYVGGWFTTIDQVSASNVASWDGIAWSPLGLGANELVLDFETMNGELIMAGMIQRVINTGGMVVPGYGVGAWTGSAWRNVDLDTTDGFVAALLKLGKLPSSPLLIAGQFEFVFAGLIGDDPVTFLADNAIVWDGGIAEPATGGIEEVPFTSAFNERLAAIQSLAYFPDDDGPIYVAGNMLRGGGTARPNILRYEDGQWRLFGIGDGLRNGAVADIAIDTADRVWVTGDFDLAGVQAVSLRGVGRYQYNIESGSGTWTPIDSGIIAGPFDKGKALAIDTNTEDHSTHTYVAGSFSSVSGVPAANIARWDGAQWTAVGGGMDDEVEDLLFWDDGSGEALYAAGSFAQAGGAPAGLIARWNDMAWSQVGAGLADDIGFNRLYTLHAYNGALYAGGRMINDFGDGESFSIAKWDGEAWSTLGAGLPGDVFAITDHDDGSGRALYAAGRFPLGGLPGPLNVGRWDGAQWVQMGDGLPGRVYAMTTYNDGSGAVLLAGGDFPSMGNLAQWDGVQWAQRGDGVAGVVRKLRVERTPNGDNLWAGGEFDYFDGVHSGRIALVRGCRCPGDASGNGSVGFEDLMSVVASYGETGDGLPADLDRDGVITFTDLNEVLVAFGSACD